MTIFHSSDYYTKSSLNKLVDRELLKTSCCSRFPNFTIEVGYVYVKFLENTDVRGLVLNEYEERESPAQCKLKAVVEGTKGTRRSFVNILSLFDSFTLFYYLNIISL